MTIRAYIRLARLDRPIGIWLLLLPAWWAIILASGGPFRMNSQDWKIFILFGIGAVLMRAVGCTINDLWDRNLDQKVARTRERPLASGEIKPAAAILFLLALSFLSLLILLQMSVVTILLGILSLPLIVIYPLMKRLTWWPQAFLGLVFNFGALMGWAAVTGVVEFPALLLYVGGIFWTLAYDTVYAYQDLEDDALIGIKSTARKFGRDGKKWVKIFYMVSLVFIMAACLQVRPRIVTLLFLFPAIAHLAWQIKRWNIENFDSALIFFKSNRDFSLLILAGMATLATF